MQINCCCCCWILVSLYNFWDGLKNEKWRENIGFIYARQWILRIPVSGCHKFNQKSKGFISKAKQYIDMNFSLSFISLVCRIIILKKKHIFKKKIWFYLSLKCIWHENFFFGFWLFYVYKKRFLALNRHQTFQTYFFRGENSANLTSKVSPSRAAKISHD